MNRNACHFSFGAEAKFLKNIFDKHGGGFSNQMVYLC